MSRTHRSPDGVYASTGAVRQNGGKLPIYICDTCQLEVVWCESPRTGRKYLVNVSSGYLGQRYYIGANVHNCAAIMDRRADERIAREVKEDCDNAAHYALSLMDAHDEGAHADSVTVGCLFCARGIK